MFRTLWKGFFDVRAGEYLRTIFMALYLIHIGLDEVSNPRLRGLT